LVIAGESRRQLIVTHALPIEPELVEAAARRIDAGATDWFAQEELATQEGHLPVALPWLNPAGTPVLVLQQAHFPPRGLAPCRLARVLIPYAGLPEVALPRGQRGAPIGPEDRLGTIDPVGIPQNTGAGFECLRALGHANLVSALSGPTAVRLDPPAESRCAVINADGI